MKGYWTYPTRWGVFSIRQSRDGRWHPMFGDEDLGSYHHPAAALEDLAGGHTATPSNGMDTERAGLPDELGEWTFTRTA